MAATVFTSQGTTQFVPAVVRPLASAATLTTAPRAGCRASLVPARGLQATLKSASHSRLSSGLAFTATPSKKMMHAPGVAFASADSVDLDPDNTSILVVGGGGVAFELVKKLAGTGPWVTFVNRTDARKKDTEKLFATHAIGDAMNVASLEAALVGKGFDAVVSTVGGTPSDARVDSEGNINVINAAKKAGVKRFILVTSVGTGDSKGAVSQQTYNVLKTVLLEKEKAEEYLKKSGLAWTIIRPGGLKSEPATGNGVLTEDKTVSGSIHRADVAALVNKCLFDKRTIGKVLTCIDKNQTYSKNGFETFNV